MAPNPTPAFEPTEIPFLKTKTAKRLTNTRLKQLLRAASRDYNDPPPKPALGECCGSSCDPCVNDLWREEVACWKERWGFSETGEVEFKEGEVRRRMPGSFEW
ncbi:hypothetical protein BDV12DRAFT_200307 [Aspergillus spectabilis]